MKKLVGGATAIILGIICLWKFPQSFLNFLAGSVPLILILSGCLTIYLKRQDETLEGPVKAKADCRDVTGCQDDGRIVAPSRIGSEEKAEAGVAPDTPNWIGNTGSLIFHSPDCKFAESKNCTVFFNFRDKAIQEGYKPCRLCNP